MLAKQNHIDNVSYKDLFYSLQNLKKVLLKNKKKFLYLKNPVEENPNLNQDMINELISFVFSKNKIEIIFINRPKITPK